MKTDTKFRIEGSWKEIKGKLKQKYASLTEDDLMYEEGQEDELLGRLQRKLGSSIDKIKEEINQL
ncbi:CsbD family protein [Algoriphagus mannitolivorans]|uniref:CsbD family protein n=1 Tax=Algoriphagus mannitolivorans TaxID=226504 RepID=UPI0003F61526|nr:CsbD family protein [Algoriphagus mannitolivorans]